MPGVTMANFEVDAEQRSGEGLIRLFGDLDLASFEAVDELLTSAQSNGNRSVRIDLRGLKFIDSSGIGLLLKAYERAQSNGHELCIIRGSERIQRVFALSDLDGRLPFCDDET